MDLQDRVFIVTGGKRIDRVASRKLAAVTAVDASVCRDTPVPTPEPNLSI